MENITIKIYNKIELLPKNWDEIAIENHFLQTSYLKVLEHSAPTNMQCLYIGIFENSQLIGVTLAQYLNLNKLKSFGERDIFFKKFIRNFVFRNFASHTLFIGNNMITGQNGYVFSKPISLSKISEILLQIANEIITEFKKNKIKIHIVTLKDFYGESAVELKKYSFSNIYEFNTQPNMIFDIPNNWKLNDDYVGAFSKKYRDQYKRSLKKSEGIVVKELTLREVKHLEKQIMNLYYYVAKNAPFNTFFLAENHFSTFKEQCGDGFKIFGYFFENSLVGFHSVLLNGKILETYFLGYDEKIQKEKMLYLNMLYNMTAFGIENNFKRIIFGRTAMEIKSSIGANPVMMSGFIYHTNKLLNKYIGKIFKKLEPETTWQQRHPFR